jgi:short-subunit dehydrogenase
VIDLTNKPILISGASSGIGAATAVACAQAGMKVGLMARREDRLQQVAQRIGEDRCCIIVGSVESDDDCNRALEECESTFGSMYAVLANAGYGQEQPCHTSSPDEIRAMFETNFYGSLRLVLPAIAAFKQRGSGHALMVSSCLSKIGLPYYGAYCATKAAQDHFCRSMRLELHNSGVHVSSVHPIGTKTEFFDEAAKKSGGTLEFAGSNNTRFLQSPERVARAIVKCLGKPKGEVWTSLPVRLALAATVAMPGLTDWGLRRMARKRAQ